MIRGARAGLAVALVHAIGSVHAGDVPHATFDAGALRRTAHGLVDVSRFEQGMPAPVGLHEVELRRNGQPLGRQRVRFAAGATRATSTPCMDTAVLRRLDLAAGTTPPPPATSDACVPIDALVPGATAHYDGAELMLSFDIPQAALAMRADDAIDPAQWDAGIDALRIDYGVAFGRASQPAAGARTRTALRLGLGANVGAWRLRHRTTHAWQSDRPSRKDTLGTTLSTDVPSLGAQFQLGDFHTSGVLFDAVGVRGVRLESDDRMLPVSLARYAPVVRGVAATRARVQVRQGGHLLADTFVAPGPFALRDLQPLGYGGAFDVRVQEADGAVQVYSVPYAAIPGLLRQGQARFSVVAGNIDAAMSAPPFMQGTFQRGVRDRVTLQFGAQLAPDYLQALGGAAISTAVGAFSIDRAHSRMAQGPDELRGASLRLAYTGQVPATDTTIGVAAWRHGNRAFRTVQDALHQRDAIRMGAHIAEPRSRERSRIDLALQQRLGRTGDALFATLAHGADHAGRARSSAQLAYTARIGRGTMHAAWVRTLRNALGANDSSASLVFSVPLSTSRARHALQVQWRDGGGAGTTGVAATGQLFESGNTAYALGISTTQHTGATAMARDASLSHATGVGIFAVGASASGAARQQSATADGALVMHRYGVTAAPARRHPRAGACTRRPRRTRGGTCARPPRSPRPRARARAARLSRIASRCGSRRGRPRCAFRLDGIARRPARRRDRRRAAADHPRAHRLAAPAATRWHAVAVRHRPHRCGGRIARHDRTRRRRARPHRRGHDRDRRALARPRTHALPHPRRCAGPASRRTTRRPLRGGTRPRLSRMDTGLMPPC